MGLDISEFPINIETAKEARQLGFYTVVGRPICVGRRVPCVRGRPLRAGCTECVCWILSAQLHGVFKMHEKAGTDLPDGTESNAQSCKGNGAG